MDMTEEFEVYQHNEANQSAENPTSSDAIDQQETKLELGEVVVDVILPFLSESNAFEADTTSKHAFSIDFDEEISKF